MPINQPRHHIIAYDIGDPKRLTRIHRYLKKRAMPIQYSVFLMLCSAAELRELVDELEQMIVPAEDDIRFYTLPRHPRIMTLGQQGNTEGVQLLGKGGEDYARQL